MTLKPFTFSFFPPFSRFSSAGEHDATVVIN
uniref:Uncharacterized protein n=1 Tax=Anguilla anguilla TaxID=7936 RepID=A0A0E9VNG6_ANGAN